MRSVTREKNSVRGTIKQQAIIINKELDDE